MWSVLPNSFLVNNLWGMKSLLCLLLVHGTKGTVWLLLPKGRLTRELSQWPLGQNILLVSRKCICRTTPTQTWNNKGPLSWSCLCLYLKQFTRENSIKNLKHKITLYIYYTIYTLCLLCPSPPQHHVHRGTTKQFVTPLDLKYHKFCALVFLIVFKACFYPHSNPSATWSWWSKLGSNASTWMPSPCASRGLLPVPAHFRIFAIGHKRFLTPSSCFLKEMETSIMIIMMHLNQGNKAPKDLNTNFEEESGTKYKTSWPLTSPSSCFCHFCHIKE